MDIKQSLTYRSEELKQFEFTGNNKYDYAKNGILNKENLMEKNKWTLS